MEKFFMLPLRPSKVGMHLKNTFSSRPFSRPCSLVPVLRLSDPFEYADCSASDGFTIDIWSGFRWSLVRRAQCHDLFARNNVSYVYTACLAACITHSPLKLRRAPVLGLYTSETWFQKQLSRCHQQESIPLIHVNDRMLARRSSIGCSITYAQKLVDPG